MADAAEFVIGAEVRCNDGTVCGEVQRVIIDPAARTATHLVVRPKHKRILDRLVPVGLVEAAEEAGGVRLDCSIDDFNKLAAAQEKHQLTETSSLGYYTLHGGGVTVTPIMGRPEVVTDETVPFGKVDIHQGDSVRASDGEIGQVEGLIVGPDDQHVTHILLRQGHLLGRKHLAIPIDAVTKLDMGVEVNLTKQQVHDLPSIDIDLSNAKQ